MLSINPFNSQEAYRFSSYSALTKAGYLQAASQSHSHSHSHSHKNKQDLIDTATQIQEFIVEDNHPCIIARSSLRGGACRFGLYPTLGSAESTAGLSRDLVQFLAERKIINHPYATYMAVFREPLQMDEETFENVLWKQLSLLHNASETFYKWDAATSSNPSDANFGFSFAGKAFYVVGMHPNSSRKARQFKSPMLIFNLHEQFENIRADGNYDKVKAVVRKNDLQLQGSLNPMLKDFGKTSEAEQYSGRAVFEHEQWKCPFLATN